MSKPHKDSECECGHKYMLHQYLWGYATPKELEASGDHCRMHEDSVPTCDCKQFKLKG